MKCRLKLWHHQLSKYPQNSCQCTLMYRSLPNRSAQQRSHRCTLLPWLLWSYIFLRRKLCRLMLTPPPSNKSLMGSRRCTKLPWLL